MFHRLGPALCRCRDAERDARLAPDGKVSARRPAFD